MLRHIATAALLISAAGAAQADIIYHYTGLPLTSTSNDSEGLISSAPITMTLTFTDTGSELLDWAISQESIGTLTKAQYDAQLGADLIFYSYFYFQTDKDGMPSKWNLTALFDWPIIPDTNMAFTVVGEMINSSGQPGSFYEYAAIYTPERISKVASLDLYESPLSATGTWTVEGGVLPKYVFPVPIPEPSTYAMLGMGLGILGFAARRRKTA